MDHDDTDDEVELSEGFIEADGGGIIPVELAEYCNFYKRRQVP